MHFDSISIWFVCERHFRQKHPSGNHLGPSPIPIILFWTLRIAAQVQISSKMALEKSRSSNALRSQMHYWKNYRKVVFKRPFYSEKRFRLNVHYVKTTSNHAAKLYYFLSFLVFSLNGMVNHDQQDILRIFQSWKKGKQWIVERHLQMLQQYDIGRDRKRDS